MDGPGRMPAPGATPRNTRLGEAPTTIWRCSQFPRQACSALSTAAMFDITASSRNSSVAMAPIGSRRTGRTANFRRTRSPTSSASIQCSNICWRCPADACRRSASPGIAVPPHPVGNVGSTCSDQAIPRAKPPRTMVPWSKATPGQRRRRSWKRHTRTPKSTRGIPCTGPAATTTGTPAAPSVTARTCRSVTTRTRDVRHHLERNQRRLRSLPRAGRATHGTGRCGPVAVRTQCRP